MTKITGIASLDHAPQVVAEWLGEVCEEMGWGPENGRAYLLLSSTLHTLRDFLTVNEAVDLAAQLPLLIRGIYFEGWTPAKAPAKPRNKSDFLASVQAHFTVDPLEDAEVAVGAVLDVLDRHVSAGEIAQVRHAMRKPIQELWA